MVAWFRPRDQLADRADALAEVLAGRLGASWDELVRATPTLGDADPARGLEATTVAATLLSLFPLLQACQGDARRHRRLQTRALAGLEARYPKSALLIAEAESGTIPPSGHERTRTLNEVDETTSLALAGWVVRRLRSKPTDRSWDEIRKVAELLRAVTAGCWKAG